MEELSFFSTAGEAWRSLAWRRVARFGAFLKAFAKDLAQDLAQSPLPSLRLCPVEQIDNRRRP